MSTIPLGLCQCGCGQPTRVSDRTAPSWNAIKGVPRRYIKGHGRKAHPAKVAATQVGTGLCECGCGMETPMASRTQLTRGYVKGQPTRFIQGHTSQVKEPLKLYIFDSASGCSNSIGRRNRYGYLGSKPGHRVG